MDDVIRCGVSETSVLTYTSVTFVYFLQYHILVSISKCLAAFIDEKSLLQFDDVMRSGSFQIFVLTHMLVQRAYMSCKSA